MAANPAAKMPRMSLNISSPIMISLRESVCRMGRASSRSPSPQATGVSFPKGSTHPAISATLLLGPEHLPHSGIARLLLGPVAAAGDTTIDHQIVAVDEGRLIAGEKHGRVGDIVGQTRARDRLCRLEHIPHLRCGVVRGLHRQPERLAENAGGDGAR